MTHTPPLSTSPSTTAPPGTNPYYASESTATAATPPSVETLIHAKGKLIHMHGLNNIWQSSTSTSSSAVAFNYDTETVTPCASASKQI